MSVFELVLYCYEGAFVMYSISMHLYGQVKKEIQKILAARRAAAPWLHVCFYMGDCFYKL